MEQPRVAAADDVPWAQRLDAVVAHWMRFELVNQSRYHTVFHTVPTENDEPLVETREVLSGLLAGGVAADEFRTARYRHRDSRGVLHAHIGPCLHAGHDREQVIADVQRLFRRAVVARDTAILDGR